MIKITKRDLIIIIVAVLVIFNAGLVAGFQMGKTNVMPTDSCKISQEELQSSIHGLQSQNQYLIGVVNDTRQQTMGLTDRLAKFEAKFDLFILKMGLK